MSKKKITWLLILVAAVFGGWYVYTEYTRTNKDLAKVKADVKISAAGFIKEYETNDSAANKKYLGKIIETTGLLKEVKKDESGYYTIVLGSDSGLSAIRCSMDTNHQQDAALLKTGTSVTMRGACTGFNKDEMGLGSDIILNRCAIIKNEN